MDLISRQIALRDKALFDGIANEYCKKDFHYLVVVAITNKTDLSPLPFMAASAASWLIGYVTPGMPAGLGVREFILLQILPGFISSTDAGLLFLSAL